MIRKKPEFDMVNELLEQCILAYPVSPFIISLYKQYQERGSLSKKQLQGLHGKSSKIPGIAPGKLATVEAIINKMPTRSKSDLPEVKPVESKDDSTRHMIDEILARYPQHKRVLFLKTKLENNEVLSPADITDLKRLQTILNKQG